MDKPFLSKIVVLLFKVVVPRTIASIDGMLRGRDDLTRIHELLWQHREQGLNIIDLANQLALSRERVKKLLSKEVSENAVRQQCTDDEQPIIYFTNLTLGPPKRSLWWPVAMRAGVFLVALVLITPGYFHVQAPQSAFEIFKARALFAVQRKTISEEIIEYQRRASLLEGAAEECRSVWRLGNLCFVNFRLLSRADVDDELEQIHNHVRSLRRRLEE